MVSERTIPGIVAAAIRESPERVFLRAIDAVDPTREPASWTFARLGLRVRSAIRALGEHGVGPGSPIVIMADNSPEWQVIALAGQFLRAEVMGLFAVLDRAAAENIVGRVEPEVVVVSSQEQLAKVSSLLPGMRRLRLLVVLDEGVAASAPCAIRTGKELLSAEPVSETELGQLAEAVSEDDLFIMIFTSGTTGRFKGVRIPHRAFIASLAGGATTLGLKEDGVGLLVLPFGHVAGQCHFYVALKTRSALILCPNRKGVTRGFSLGPTYALLVPYFCERIRRDVLRQLDSSPRWASSLLKGMVAAAGRAGMSRSPRWRDRILSWLAARVVGRKLRSKLGGRLRVIASAGATPDFGLVGFFRGLGFELLNYYGMSETAGTIALDSVLDREKCLGSTGKPWRTVQVRIAGDGEIEVRGETLFAGYFDKQDDAEAFTPDGYFRTGDIGRLDDEGYLFVTGRKKHLIVLRTGEKVSAEAMELKISSILPLEGSVAIGEGEAFVCAGLFVGQDELERLQAQLGRDAVEDHLSSLLREGFAGSMEFSIPEKVFIIPGSPGDYPELVTPTLKIKRPAFLMRFREQIDRIYGR